MRSVRIITYAMILLSLNGVKLNSQDQSGANASSSQANDAAAIWKQMGFDAGNIKTFVSNDKTGKIICGQKEDAFGNHSFQSTTVQPIMRSNCPCCMTIETVPCCVNCGTEFTTLMTYQTTKLDPIPTAGTTNSEIRSRLTVSAAGRLIVRGVWSVIKNPISTDTSTIEFSISRNGVTPPGWKETKKVKPQAGTVGLREVVIMEREIAVSPGEHSFSIASLQVEGHISDQINQRYIFIVFLPDTSLFDEMERRVPN